jgi:uncharacterized membrane protein YfcA
MMDTAYLAPPVFFIIAFVFSMLGMGGAQLYIPILFWLGMDFKTGAIPLGMLLNVVNSSSAATTYGRKGMIDWRVAMPFGAAMVALAPLGAWANVSLPTKPVIVIFALFTATAALVMLSDWRPAQGQLSSGARAGLGVGVGGVLGFFAGLIGRGGGSFVVPLLYIAGLEPRAAAATSALVVTFSGTSSFLSHIATAAEPQWTVWVLSAAAVFAGGQVGSRFMAERLRSSAVRSIFGCVLLAVAALLIIKDVAFG